MPKIINLDTNELLDMVERQYSTQEMAELTGVSIPTLKKRLDDLSEKQGLLLRARDLRNLRLTELQMMILEGITAEKIQNADLRDLATAFKVFSDRENLDLGKPTEVKGLVGYLVHLEKETLASRANVAARVMDALESKAAEESVEVEDVLKDDLEYLPKL